MLYQLEISDLLKQRVGKMTENMDDSFELVELFCDLSEICKISGKPIVLVIDEVDQASNNQVFLDFLAQLRGYYLRRSTCAAFQSVILAGVHDVRNLRQKIRPIFQKDDKGVKLQDIREAIDAWRKNKNE